MSRLRPRTFDELAAMPVMVDRTERTYAPKPKRLIADTVYGTGRFLGWLVKEKAITPHIPVWDMSKRKDGAFSRFDFTFDKRRNLYICPTGKTLTTTGRVAADNGIRYRAAVADCRVCPLKPNCCPGMVARRIVRDLDTAWSACACVACPVPELSFTSPRSCRSSRRWPCALSGYRHSQPARELRCICRWRQRWGRRPHGRRPQKPQSALHLPDQTDSQASTPLAADSFNSIGHLQQPKFCMRSSV